MIISKPFLCFWAYLLIMACFYMLIKLAVNYQAFHALPRDPKEESAVIWAGIICWPLVLVIIFVAIIVEYLQRGDDEAEE